MHCSFVRSLSILVTAALAACGPTAVATPPDAAPDASTVPRTPAGTFAITGQLDLPTIPPPAAAILDELADATDDPDDPARYLVDRVVAGMPDGAWKSVASGLAPFIAPYLEAELATIAPKLAPGVRAIVAGLGSIAHHVGTREVLAIDRDGGAVRTVASVVLGAAVIGLRDVGLPDPVGVTRVVLDPRGELVIASHAIVLPYGRLLRLGLDRAVIPGIVPGAVDLATALVALVDCRRVGEVFAAHAGLGWPGLYTGACVAGLTALAHELDDRLDAIDAMPFGVTSSGTARGLDRDADGAMDAIMSGTWTGTTTYASTQGPLGAATFEGTRR